MRLNIGHNQLKHMDTHTCQFANKRKAMALLNARNSRDWQCRHNSLCTCASDANMQYTCIGTIIQRHNTKCMYMYIHKERHKQKTYMCTHAHAIPVPKHQRYCSCTCTCMYIVHAHVHVYVASDSHLTMIEQLIRPRLCLALGTISV